MSFLEWSILSAQNALDDPPTSEAWAYFGIKNKTIISIMCVCMYSKLSFFLLNYLGKNEIPSSHSLYVMLNTCIYLTYNMLESFHT